MQRRNPSLPGIFLVKEGEGWRVARRFLILEPSPCYSGHAGRIVCLAWLHSVGSEDVQNGTLISGRSVTWALGMTMTIIIIHRIWMSLRDLRRNRSKHWHSPSQEICDDNQTCRFPRHLHLRETSSTRKKSNFNKKCAATVLDETNCKDILPEPRQQYRWYALRQRLGTVRGWPPGASIPFSGRSQKVKEDVRLLFSRLSRGLAQSCTTACRRWSGPAA